MIQSLSIKLKTDTKTEAALLKEYITTKLRRGFGRLSGMVQGVNVTISDENGPVKGGADIRCRISVAREKGNTLVVDELGACRFAVIGNAIQRMKRRVFEEIKRSRVR